MKKQEIYWIVICFLAWRVALFLISISAGQFLTYNPSFPYAFTLLPQFGLPQWLYSWAGFDGVHYLTIAIKGYHAANLIQAFFPIYPLLIWLISLVLSNAIVVGLFISNAAFLGLLLIFYTFVKQQYQAKTAWMALFVLLLFPSSFFLGALYSESLFLLTIVLAFYFASHNRWWLVAGLAIFASATRLVGIFIVPALVLELAGQKQVQLTSPTSVAKFFRSNLQTVALLCLGALGLFGYMYYLWHDFGDPLYFWHVQSDFGAGRQESIILLPQVIWRYFKILTTVSFDRTVIIYVQELLFGLVPLGLIVYHWFKRTIPSSWALFSVLSLLLPTLTGTFSSMARYSLVAFPLFIILARYLTKQPRWLQVLLLSISAILLTFNLVLFIQGYWVA